MNKSYFVCVRSLNAHSSVHSKETSFTCNLCEKKFISRSKLNSHILSQHERLRRQKHLRCNLCHFEVHQQSLLIQHMRKHTGERPFECTVDGCRETFKTKPTLKSHVCHKHSNERPFKCHFPGCHYSGKSRENLFAHKKTHSDDRPFACPNVECNYRAKFRQDIEIHVTGVHSETKTLACSKCDFKTSSKSGIKYHVMHGHSTRRDFKYSHPQCTKSFKTSRNLKYHFSNCHEERNTECGLSGCEGKLSNNTALNAHKRRAHSKKTIACPNLGCKFRTNTLAILARHVIIHDAGDEKIPCSIESCEFEGRNRIAIVSHIRHHKTRLSCPVPVCNRKTFTEKAFKKHSKLHNPVGRPFHCPLCCQYFPTLTRFFSHSFVHTNEKPLKCGHCEFGTCSRTGLKRQISRAHANIKCPFIVLPLEDRECLHCKVVLPVSEFLVHSMRHVIPVLMLERLEIRRS